MDQRPTADQTSSMPDDPLRAAAPGRLYLIRPYREADAQVVGQLIADTYSRFNLGFAASGELASLLGPFQHAGSAEPAHREAIAQVLRAPMVYVAEGRRRDRGCSPRPSGTAGEPVREG